MQKFNKNFLGIPNCVFVPKGWGYEYWIWNNEDYCGKELFVKKGKRCSIHYHIKKDETFHIISGQLSLEYSKEDFDNALKDSVKYTLLHAGDTFHIPANIRHRFMAWTDTKIIEFSTFHDESDVVRLIVGD